MNNPQGPVFPLPENLDPPLDLCLQLTIPNDAEYYQQLYSLLNIATYWFAWDRDAAHGGRVVANTWKRILETLEFCSTPSFPVGGLMEDFEMPLRVDCDCNVFVTCCDGTEKQILTADQVKAIAGGQPGQGTPSPGPGGCTTYSATIVAGQAWLMPTLVNTGDVLTASDFGGATTDVAPLGRWNIFDGEVFQLGEGQGNQVHDPTSVDPALFLGQIMYTLGGLYYDATIPFTVPGGVSNAPIAMVINYPASASFAGNLTCHVQVCNNQSGTFRHVFDFTTTPATFQPYTDALFITPIGVWVAGVGWDQTLQVEGGVGYRAAAAGRSFPARTITRMTMTYDLVPGHNDSGGAPGLFGNVGGTATFSVPWNALASGSGQIIDWTGSVPGATNLFFFEGVGNQLGGIDPGGTGTVTQLVVEGIGSDPF